MNSPSAQPSISTDCERPGVEHALAWVRGRLRGRPDREHEITLNRVMFSALINLYLLIATSMGGADAAAMLQITTPPFVLYFIVTVALFAHILWQPQVCERRRVFGMACDFGMLTFLAIAGGLKAGFFYPIYLWTVFGNGFRFGIPYLFIAMGFANASFLAVLIATNVWREHTGLSIA